MDALSREVATFVLNSLWQVALVAAAAMFADLLLRRGPARYRHVLWVGSLGAAIVLPLASVQPRVQTPPDAAIAAAEASLLPESGKALAIPVGRAKAKSSSGWWTRLSIASRHRMLSLPPWLALAALALYLVFVAFMLARFVRACVKTRQIRHLASVVDPLPRHVTEALEHCRHGLTRRGSQQLHPFPPVLSSTRIPGPVTVGVRRPAIILPATLLEPAGREDLTAALAHEMAHIRRRDYLWNLIYELLYLPLSFHPLALLILRRLCDTRELACDELAAQVLSTSTYARSLVRLAHEMSRRAGAALAPNYTLGVFDANILEERVMRLLKPRASGHLARVSLLSAAVLISSLSLAAMRFSIGIAQPAGSTATAQAATGDQAWAKFLGAWTAKFEGKTYVALRLKLQDRQVQGTISTGEVNLDAKGDVNEVTEEAQAPVAIFDAKVEGGKFYFKQKDGDDTLNYEMEVNDAAHAQLKILNSGAAAVQPVKVTRETGSEAVSSQAMLRPVAYADVTHKVKGAISGGISSGVAGGTSGAVPGGVSGGVIGGVSDGVPGATSRVQGGEVPAKNSENKTGSLSGIVVDSSGARIPKADVRLVSRNNAFQKSVQSDDTGNFSFDEVPAGRYTLEVSSAGMGGTFRSFEFKTEGEPPFFPFVLHPGSLAETVAVTAKTPQSLGDKATKLGPRRIRVGGAVEAAKLIENRPPEYPESAKARGAQGMVVLEATIAADGTPENFKVISSPDDDLTKAALDAVIKWRYQPTLLNGDPVEVVTTVAVNFTLQD